MNPIDQILNAAHHQIILSPHLAKQRGTKDHQAIGQAELLERLAQVLNQATDKAIWVATPSGGRSID